MVKALAPRARSGFAGWQRQFSRFFPNTVALVPRFPHRVLSRLCSGRCLLPAPMVFAIAVGQNRFSLFISRGISQTTHSFSAAASRSATLAACSRLVGGVSTPFFWPRSRTFCLHSSPLPGRRYRGPARFDTPNKVGIATPSVSPIPAVQPSLMKACSAIFTMACATNVLPLTLPIASLRNADDETALSTGSPRSNISTQAYRYALGGQVCPVGLRQ